MKIFLSWFVIIFLIQTVYGQWEPTFGPFGGSINDLGQNSTYQFAATPNGLYRSEDDGLNWIHVSYKDLKNKAVLQLFSNDSVIIVDAVDVSNGIPVRQLYKSENNGMDWKEMDRPNTTFYADIELGENEVYLLDLWGFILYCSKDGGSTWEISKIHDVSDQIYSMYSFKSQTYICSANKIYKSSDIPDQWIEIPVPGLVYPSQIYVNDSLFFVIEGETLFRSQDKGETWTTLENNIVGSHIQIAKIHDDYYYLFPNGYLYKSENNGTTWVNTNTAGLNLGVSLISSNETLLIGCAWKGIYRSDNQGGSAHFSSHGIDAAHVTKLIIREDELLTGGVYQSVSNYDLHLSTWDDAYFDERFTEAVLDMEIFEGSLYLLTRGTVDLFKYSDQNHHWLQTTDPFSCHVSDMYVVDNMFYVGGQRERDNCHLQVSYFNWQNWNDHNVYVDNKYYDISIIASHHKKTIGSDGKTVIISDDNGESWNLTPGSADLGVENNKRIIDLFDLNGKLYSILYNSQKHQSYLLRSTNEGNSWDPIDQGIPKSETTQSGIKNIIQIGDHLIATTYGHADGIYFTQIDNINWQPFNDNLPSRSSNDLISHNEYMYVATEGHGVWRRKIEDLMTNSTDQSLLTGFALYPNPAKDEIIIKMPNETIQNSTVYISDLNGKFYPIDPIMTDDGINIDVHSLPGGFYLLSVINNHSVFTSRFIIQR